MYRSHRAVRLASAGNGASFGAFRQHTRVRLLPALRFRFCRHRDHGALSNRLPMWDFAGMTRRFTVRHLLAALAWLGLALAPLAAPATAMAAPMEMAAAG